MNTVYLLGGSFFLPEASAKNIICAGIDLLFGGILYFFTSQVPGGFCVALILVMTESLSPIKYKGGEKEFLWLLQGTNPMFRSWKFSCLLSSCSHRKNWKCVCERLNRWRGRNECAAPVPTCPWMSKCLLRLLSRNGFTKLFFENVFTIFFHFFLLSFSNPCQAPFLRIYQDVLHRQFFTGKVKHGHVGSYFGYLKAKVLKLQEGRGRTSF